MVKYFVKGVVLAWKEFRFIIPRKLWKSYFKHTIFKLKYGNQSHLFYDPSNENEYNKWLAENEKFDDKVCNGENFTIVIFSDNNFKNRDKIEESLLKQTYQDFEVKYANEIDNIDSEYILFVNSDDVLSKICLNEIAKVNADIIYFDEDKLKNDKRICPKFKPDFSPDTLLGKNYIGNCFAIKTDLCDINEINNNSLYDLIIRKSEEKVNIFHISKILVHKYSNNIVSNNLEIIENALDRRGKKGNAIDIEDGIIIDYHNENELVSIIIPTRDGSDILSVCLKSIYEKTTYKNYEIIVVDNG
ncbi:MAG: glycosyltransferase family 2 protein, partial [Bacilli bacterium]